MTAVVALRNLTAGVAQKPILDGVNLDISDRKMTGLMGPMGAGKSTLLNFLSGAGAGDGLTTGFTEALYCGRPIAPDNCPLVIRQKKRTAQGWALTDRLGEISSVCAQSGAMLCIDEPTAGLTAPEGEKVMETLRDLAGGRAVLVVSHNAEEIRWYCDDVALIAGGKIVVATSAEKFFDGRSEALATHFLQTGGLDIPYDGTPLRNLKPEDRVAPGGFDLSAANPAEGVENWIIEGKFSILSLPVRFDGSLETDGLARLSPRKIFHFERSRLKVFDTGGTVAEKIDWGGDDSHPDRNPALTANICAMIEALLAAGAPVCVNTGFNQGAGAASLGAYYVFKGFSPADAMALTAKKFPQLHFGMRLEQLFWNVELEFSTRQ